MIGIQRMMAVLLAAAWLALAGCGQSGPLYLPGNPSRVQVENPEPATEEAGDTTEDDEEADARD